MASVHRIPREGRPWRARYWVNGRERSRTFVHKATAERWLRGQLAAVDRGEWVDPKAARVTLFDGVAAGWLAALDGSGLKPKTVAGYREVYGSRIAPTFEGSPVAMITRDTVEDWLAEMAAAGVSAARMRAARGVLCRILDTAVASRIVTTNPVAGVRVRATTASREPVFLTADQLHHLAAEAEIRSPGSGLVVEVLGWVGLRFGELVALRAGRVDPVRGRLVVAESATEVDGRGLVFGSPKNHRSREVTVPGPVMAALAARVEEMPADALVFTAAQGRALRANNWRRRVFAPAVASAGLDATLRPHDLRHTAASLAIAAGAPIKAIQRQLGHASATMTLDRYGHLYPDDLDALGQALTARYTTTVPAHSGHRRPEGLET